MASQLELLIAAAESAIGVDYKWGGNSLATGVDCSGLIQQAFWAAGIAVPRVSNQQARAGRNVSWEDMQPGDLIWMDYSDRNDGADHIAIYIGNGKMIEAPSAGKQVQVVNVPSPDSRRIPMGVTRITDGLAATEGTDSYGVVLGPNQSRTYTNQAIYGSATTDRVSAYIEGGGQPGTAASPVSSVSMETTASGAVPDSIAVTGSPGGGLGDDLPDNASEQQTLEYIANHFPQLAAFLGNDEIRYVLTWGVREDKSEAEIQGALRKTNYWKTHGPESRAFDALLGTDHKAAENLINSTRILVDQAYQQQGIHKSHEELDKITLGYIRGGWTPADLERSVANELSGKVDEGVGLGAGTSSADADSYIATARAMGLPLDRKTAEKWALDVAAGRDTDKGVRAKLQKLAEGRWQYDPEVLAYIQSGHSAADYFDVHRNVIADTLELNPESIDLFNDPRYASVTQIYDPNTKTRRAMTTGEVADWARHQDSYKNTARYKSTSADFTSNLLETFGEVA